MPKPLGTFEYYYQNAEKYLLKPYRIVNIERCDRYNGVKSILLVIASRIDNFPQTIGMQIFFETDEQLKLIYSLIIKTHNNTHFLKL